MDDEHAVSRVKLHKEAKLALNFESCMTAVEGCRSPQRPCDHKPNKLDNRQGPPEHIFRWSYGAISSSPATMCSIPQPGHSISNRLHRRKKMDIRSRIR